MSQSDAYFQQIMETGLISIRPVHETDGLFMVQSDGHVYGILLGCLFFPFFLMPVWINEHLHSPLMLPALGLWFILCCLGFVSWLLSDGVSYVFFLDRVELRLQGVTYLKKRAKRRRDGVEHLFGEKPQKKERRQLRFRTLPRERLAALAAKALPALWNDAAVCPKERGQNGT